MENKPKMILELDEYNKLLNNSKKDSEIAICLLRCLSGCMLIGGDKLMFELQDYMTNASYTIKYNSIYGEAVFGKGDKVIVINRDKEVSVA